MTTSTKLALCGGDRAVPEGLIKPWPPIDDVERSYVMASLEGEHHAFGPNCEALQEEFAAWNGNRHAVTTNSGTAALHMGVAASGAGAGDEVIVPAYSWSSSATCVLQHNAIPIFVDIDFDTMNIDVDKIEDAITSRTKAIIVVHLHGLAVEMAPVLEIARAHGLKVIEDACQGHGATYHGRKVGTWGDSAAFSFNQNKNLPSGEGGMFVTDDEEMLERARTLWSFGETRTPSDTRDYHVYAMGWMYRNNDLTAAFGRAQLTKLDGYLAHQAANAHRLADALQDVPGLILPQEPEGYRHNWYNYVLRFDMAALAERYPKVETVAPRALRDRIVDALQAEGVPNGVWQHFILPAMTVFQAKNGYGKGCPWDCQHAAPVDYSLEQYPVAQRHCDTHTCISMALREPNGPDVVDAMAVGIRKVMTHLDQVLGAMTA